MLSSSSSSLKNTSSASTKNERSPVEEEESYTVLYYKRKNKVHKSKGVSKMDGVLTVVPAPPKALVTLKDGETTVFRGKIAPKDLQMDDMIVLGGYEVEILSRDKSRNTCTAVEKKTQNNSTKTQPLLSSRKLHVASKKFSGRGPLHPKAASHPLAAPGTGTVSKKATYRPPQPSKKRTTNELYALSDKETSSDDSDDGFAVEAQKENVRARGSIKRPPLASTTTSRFPPFKKQTRKVSPIPTTSTTAGSRNALPPSTRHQPQKSHHATRTATPQSVVFPGAVGNVDVPHSIKNALKPHQVEGVTFLWNSLTGNGKASADKRVYKGAILADEMGLGKTLMTIAVICALHRQKRDMRFVVVCPSSLVANWAKEFDKWMGKASQPKRVVVKKGGEEGLNQIKAFSTVKPNQPQVIIISYDLFRMNASLFQQFKKVGLLVVDEGHRLKNTAGSLTLTALESLPCDARICITATPIQNILSDFFNLANFVCPGILGDLATFRKEYERPISASNNKNCSSEQRRLGLAQSRILDEITQTFMLRRLQKDILKTMLPPRNEVLLFCRPTSQQCKLYKEITTQQGTGLALGPTAGALTTLTSLRKLCSHPALVVEDSASDPSCATNIALSGKLSLLDSLLATIRTKAAQDKVVIVSNYTSALSIIENSILKPRGLTYVRLDGTTELSKRQGIVDTFNRTSSQRNFAFLLSSKAGGCGLNLIGANRLVMFDPDWNPASDIQAMARIYRQGQEKPCTIYRLFTSGTVEEVICQRQMQKGNLATLTVDGVVPKSRGTATGFTKEEIRDCFTLKEDCDCDTKLKVGDRWPSYDGPASIESQGCADPPLLAVASEDTTPLAFVHVVKQEVEKIQSAAESIDSSTKDLTETSEEESQSDDEESRGGMKMDEESSDEEFEF